ncbi:MAG: sigma-54 dependent transcriptional regulator [Bacteroidales bacterium]|nr:sigma-54 dependent transcriptional regulator [Bacteroidales bacterium]
MNRKEIVTVKNRFGIVGNDEALLRAVDVAMQVAPTELSVLITGENGVGKEVIPKIIHQFSSRKHGKYVAVNCGAIPEGTINSELFGHVKGAFTGADKDRKGYFAEADGGTIFLDEVGELPLATQAMLLRVLENHEYMVVGSSNIYKTDVRIIAATNVNMMEAIAQGRFREDLYYRLNTIPINIPALRERGNDIVLLFTHFSMQIAERYSMPPIQLTDSARRLLCEYPWPGNVRQLRNIVEHISVVEQNRMITEDTLQLYLPNVPNSRNLPMLSTHQQGGKMFENEREILYSVLFDLRRDMTEMKRVVNELIKEREMAKHPSTLQPTFNIESVKHTAKVAAEEDIQDTEAYEEENLSLNNSYKELLKKALNKHQGNRRDAAKELDISERTLYRKIKEYDLE